MSGLKTTKNYSSKKKKIAIFHELDKGGARRAANEFANHLRKYYTVELFIVDEKQNVSERNFFDKVHFYKFTKKAWNGNNWRARLYRDTIELFKLYALHKKIATKINGDSFVTVLTLPSKYTQAPFIHRFLKIPTIYYCQEGLRMVYEDLFKVGKEVGMPRFLYEKIIRLYRKTIDRRNLMTAGKVLTNSDYTGSNILKFYGLKTKTVYMGVDVKKFHPNKKNKKFDVLYIGSLDKSDNVELFRNAISLIKNKKLKVRELIKENEWISSDTVMRDLYCSARIVICLQYKEPFGLLPIEAMSCGVPVIALNDGGYKETVLAHTGVRIRPNASELAKVITSLLSDNVKLKKLGSASREEAVKNWSWSVSASKLHSEIERLVTL